MHKQKDKKYKRILLKLSGEALGSEGLGIDPRILDRMALEIGQLVGIGVQVGLVIGGGNLFRGAALHAAGMDRVTGDHMGMLATVMNALAMRDALERSNISSAIMSAIPMSGVVDHYDRRKAIRQLSQGDVVIFAAGTGNPVLHHRFGSLPARHRGRSGTGAEGHQGRRCLYRRSVRQSGRGALRAPELRRSARTQARRDGPHGDLPVPGPPHAGARVRDGQARRAAQHRHGR
jgi:hypothetical protein